MTDTNPAGMNVDVVDILTADHWDMMGLIEQIESTPDVSQRRDLADTLIAEVMRHAVAEEMYVYPAIKDHVPNGADEVEHDKKFRPNLHGTRASAPGPTEPPRQRRGGRSVPEAPRAHPRRETRRHG